MSETQNSFFNTPFSRIYSFYLCGEIAPPENYIEWFQAIRMANENDVIQIHINSRGGNLSTALQFMRVLAETPATVIASVEGDCMSAATMIFLSVDSYQISDHSCFMFHNYSGFIYGKGGEMFDNIMFERKWSEKLMKDVYKDFLTEEEINSILENRDIWMDADEVIERIKKREEIRQSQTNKKRYHLVHCD